MLIIQKTSLLLHYGKLHFHLLWKHLRWRIVQGALLLFRSRHFLIHGGRLSTYIMWVNGFSSSLSNGGALLGLKMAVFCFLFWQWFSEHILLHGQQHASRSFLQRRRRLILAYRSNLDVLSVAKGQDLCKLIDIEKSISLFDVYLLI